MASRTDLTGVEHFHQVAFFEWASLSLQQFPELEYMFAIPNGGHRHPAVAAKLKREGVRAGVLDIFLPVARGGFHGLFIEMKSIEGKPSDKQKKYLAFLKAQGYCAEVCNNVDAAIFLTHKYLEGEWIRASSAPGGATAPSSSSPPGPA